MYSGQYTGTGTYGSDNPTSITFPFATPIVFIPFSDTSRLNFLVPRPLYAAQLSTTSWTNIASSNARNLYAKVSQDNKTYYWYADYYSSSNKSEAYKNAYNTNGVVYFYVGFGGYDVGGQTEWLLTDSQTWVVPRTGKYYIELYGGGGRAGCPKHYSVTGRSSCQSYNNVNLSARQKISVIVGKGGESRVGNYDYTRDGTSGTETKFGTYSVDGGKATNYGGTYDTGWILQVGDGAGNLGTQGYQGVKGSIDNQECNYSTGHYGYKYGYGGFADYVDNSSQMRDGGPRAVYLKYLGA